MPTEKPFHLKAETSTVAELVTQVKRGLIRIPAFQRPLRWEAKDVKLFFDSLYQGYPIGSFLMRKAPAEASLLYYGSVQISAPSTNSAWWVVDGQQRLTALVVGLGRKEEMPKTSEDPWVLYFDAKEKQWCLPPKYGDIPSTWIPVNQLLDASALSEWVFHWKHQTDSSLRQSVFDAGTRIRQYTIPLYIIETEDEIRLRDIFYRVNDAGKKMRWEDIHDALFGRNADEPSTLKELADHLQSLHVGRPSEEQLLSALLSFKGLDATRSIAEHYRQDPASLRNTVADALPALKQVLTFLKTRAEIPHIRLLPRSLPFFVLTKFFGFYPEPNERTLQLLVRWTWRTLLTIKSVNERTYLRHSLKAIEGKEYEETMQRLLRIIPQKPKKSFVLPPQFDARAADNRIALVVLNSLRPLDLETAKRIDTADMIEKYDRKAFRKIISANLGVDDKASNRLLLPPTMRGVQEKIEKLCEAYPSNAQLLLSHCIDNEAAEHLLQKRFDDFLLCREKRLLKEMDSFAQRLAAWDKNDRPSIQHILRHTRTEE
jgi:hypothetical protein